MTYKLDITIDNSSLISLHDNNFNLYVFKGSASDAAGQPLVWQVFKSPIVHLTTTVSWEEKYAAFVSSKLISDDVNYTSEDFRDIELGQVLAVDENANTYVDPTATGTANSIEINNKNKTTDYTCGICQYDPNSKKMLSMCAFNLIRNTEDTIIPIEKIALYFATETIDAGTVRESAKGHGIVIDFTTLQERTASFSLEDGWKTTDGGSQGITFEPDTKLSSLLITKKTSKQIVKEALSTKCSSKDCYPDAKEPHIHVHSRGVTFTGSHHNHKDLEVGNQIRCGVIQTVLTDLNYELDQERARKIQKWIHDRYDNYCTLQEIPKI